MKSTRGVVSALAALLVVVAGGSFGIVRIASQRPQRLGLPRYEVDSSWPKIPDKWILGQVGGITVDSQDHVWLIHRPYSTARGGNPPGSALGGFGGPLPQLTVNDVGCCEHAPGVQEYDAEGNFIRGWGGAGWDPAYPWPLKPHGIYVDPKGNVWIGGGSPGKDTFILKLTQAGKLIRQIGQPNVTGGTNDPDSTNAAADFRFYPETNELFVADGYGNRRVLVVDADTGKYKRHWGAFGKKPDESAKTGYEFPPQAGQSSPQLNFPHAIGISKDGFLYLMEFWNRIQVFKLDGTFVRDVTVANTGRFTGVNFSPDPDQQYLYVSDAGNNVIWFLDRSSLRVVGKLGREGPYAGQFEGLHQFAVDSKGNIYTSEITGQKVQKFVFQGFWQ